MPSVFVIYVNMTTTCFLLEEISTLDQVLFLELPRDHIFIVYSEDLNFLESLDILYSRLDSTVKFSLFQFYLMDENIYQLKVLLFTIRPNYTVKYSIDYCELCYINYRCIQPSVFAFLHGQKAEERKYEIIKSIKLNTTSKFEIDTILQNVTKISVY